MIGCLSVIPPFRRYNMDSDFPVVLRILTCPSFFRVIHESHFLSILEPTITVLRRLPVEEMPYRSLQKITGAKPTRMFMLFGQDCPWILWPTTRKDPPGGCGMAHLSGSKASKWGTTFPMAH